MAHVINTKTNIDVFYFKTLTKRYFVVNHGENPKIIISSIMK